MGTTTTKSTEPTTIAVEAPDNEWPEAWLMDEEGDDQKKPNKLSPNVPVDAAAMREIGISYWKMDAENYTYPVKSVPWDPKDSTDPKLSALSLIHI